MGKYQAYPEYKDSGVEWLDEIPSHWRCTRLKRYCKVTDGSHHSPKIEADGYPFISVTDVGVNSINFSDAKRISLKDYGRLVREGCKPSIGDVLLTKDGTIGRACIVKEDMPDFVILSSLGLLTPKEDLINSYLYYYLVSGVNVDQMNSMIHGSALRRMTISKIDDLILVLPSYDEQTKIASFLDHETAKIDTLIDKQQQLIKLLKEKRQVVISHAVTKGLNPDAPMKDSGVEWLGKVPEHWDVKKAKYLFDFVTSGSRGWAEYYADSGSLFFRIANLTRDTVEPKLSSIQCVQPPKGAEGERSKIRLNDLLISITADLGSVCVANESIANGYVSQHVALCRPNNQLVKSSRWLAYFVLSDTAKEQLLGSGYGGTKVQLSLEDIRELVIAFPPKEEQLQIEAYIDTKLSQFENLMQKANMQVELLQERRTALISAAVTGKIDVRDWNKEN
ncbi:restriction endonuclease subunit S [Vibrio sp. 2089]|uniref:restriction endonuclease subunit S n=1 Tax=Vibrio sp. 2089 TaxID=3074591 RepID=UPI0021D2EDC0|nr:restriction endonuclease subunit S [Vibrio sp. 2089]MDW2109005.1 restriction endonuclease subunit S [Vibrio sp. 2089]